MVKKVLITGANGFIGNHLIQSSLLKGLEVYAGVRKTSITKHIDGLPINFVEIDYADKERLIQLLQINQFDYIIHNAGTTKAKNYTEYLSVNAEITKTIIKAIEDSGCNPEKFAYISSLASQGPAENINSASLKADHSPNPISMYGKSKLVAEKYLAATKTLNYIIFRPTAVYGPLEKDLFILVKTIKNYFEPYIGLNKQKLSFVYVEDLTNLIVDSLNTNASRKAYVVSDGNDYGRYDFADIIKRFLDRKTLKVHIPVSIAKLIATTLELSYKVTHKTPTLNREKLNELTATNWSCDISETIIELEYSPQFNLEQGLIKTLKWYKQNKWI